MALITLENIYKVYENKTLAIDNFNLDINKNEFIVLIGPSGCGKSTLLRMIAGLEEISYGKLIIDGKVMNNVHPKDRGISMVFQNYALYPHMTNYNNIAFGLKNQKTSKPVIDKKVKEAANMLELNDYLDKKPSELSGGQRQRVALGRAMVQNSNIFLMDEPLSNLDAKLRSKMRMEILRLHRKLDITTIYVTHDQIEAMTMADRIVVINSGVVQQIGTPKEIYYNPKNLFVAKFIGDPEINILNAHVDDEKIVISDKEYDAGEKYRNIIKDYNGKEIKVGVRPESIKVYAEPKKVENELLVKSKIELIEMRGDYSVLILKGMNSEFRIKVSSYIDYNLDQTIYLGISMNDIYIFDSESEKNILIS